MAYPSQKEAARPRSRLLRRRLPVHRRAPECVERIISQWPTTHRFPRSAIARSRRTRLRTRRSSAEGLTKVANGRRRRRANARASGFPRRDSAMAISVGEGKVTHRADMGRRERARRTLAPVDSTRRRRGLALSIDHPGLTPPALEPHSPGLCRTNLIAPDDLRGGAHGGANQEISHYRRSTHRFGGELNRHRARA